MEAYGRDLTFLIVGKDFLKGVHDCLDNRERGGGRASQAEEILQMKAPRKQKNVGCSGGKRK